MSKNKRVSISKIEISGAGTVDVTMGLDDRKHRYFNFAHQGKIVNAEPVPAQTIVTAPKKLMAELTKGSINLFSQKAQSKFINDLQAATPTNGVFQVANKVGWFRNCFVLPGNVIGKRKKPLFPALAGLDRSMLQKYKVRGSAKQWAKEVGILCNGNSRLMFAVSLAFSGPILALLSGQRSGGFQFVGTAEMGKTTAAVVAGSILGGRQDERGFLESWNSTAGKLELTALAHNDTLLILDESRRVGVNDKQRAEQFQAAIFNLAEAVERDRLTNAMSARTWKFFWLGTGNFTVSEMLGQGGVHADDATWGRCSDIPAPNGGFGVFDDLKGFGIGADLSRELKRRCTRYYGAPFAKFVQSLVRARKADKDALRRDIKKLRGKYLSRMSTEIASNGLPNLERINDRYATVYAAGSLAIRYGILPFSKMSLMTAILSCQIDGLTLLNRDRASAPSAPSAASARTQLIDYLAKHAESFRDVTKKPLKKKADLEKGQGYTAKFKRRRWYYLTAAMYKSALRSQPQRVRQDLLISLNSEGYVEPATQRPVYRKGPGNKHFRRVHAFSVDLIRS